MNGEEYIVLDIETTGLSKYVHEITEIAAVKIKNGKCIDEFQTLVNPQVHIPSFITKLTGIDNKMVKDAPKIKNVLPELLDFLGNTTIIAHNATFDYGFISYNVEKHLNKTIDNKTLCTRKLANRLLPDLPRKRLKDLCDIFNVNNKQAHRAMADTKATAKIFNKFVYMMKLADIKTTEDILKFEKNPIKR